MTPTKTSVSCGPRVSWHTIHKMPNLPKLQGSFSSPLNHTAACVRVTASGQNCEVTPSVSCRCTGFMGPHVLPILHAPAALPACWTCEYSRRNGRSNSLAVTYLKATCRCLDATEGNGASCRFTSEKLKDGWSSR